TLLTVCSLAENNAVWNAAQAAGITGGLWIGYTDQVSEGNWVWQDGSTCTFTNWNPGEPNNSSCFPSTDGEDGAVIQMSNGRWNDVYLGPTGACFNPAAYASLIKVNLCPQVTATATPTPVCLGSPVQLSATTILGSNPFNYTWTTTGNVPIGTGSPLSYQPTGNTTATVVSTDLYGCTASSTVNITTQSCNTNNCVTEPFCTGNTYTFPAGVNQTDASITYPGNNYDCLGSSPNPQWYYMEISQAGTLSINMSNSSAVDIDFILYGPYPNYTNAMTYCNNFGNATSASNLNTVVDCSFSTAATETADIANAQVGEVYVLLITNFSNTATNISFSGSGTAATDCSIVTPTCSFTGITGNVSACNGTNNSYTITGSVSYTDPPTTGTLTLTNSCGGSQTFNAPFGTSQNYSITGNANGASCAITASFSADASCTTTLNYTAPPSCTCPAEVGTYNTNIIGNSNSTMMLCYGDTIDITSNNNWTPPAEIIGATDPNSPNYDANAPVYDPGIAWLLYSCPPSVALNPAQSATSGLDIPDDPCLIGIIAGTPDVFDVNNLSLINSFPAGTFTNNTVYLVPLTMYSVQDGIYSYIILPAQDCYELGTPIVVQYLPQVTFTQTQNCANGTATATISGGAAQLNGTNFSVVPGSISPASAQAVNSTTNNGGTITLGGLQTGPYSFQVEDANGCPVTISGNYTGAQTANLSYNDNLFCLNDPNPTATVTGTQGGTFASGAGLILNNVNGNIDLANSTPGVYTITYTTPGPLCPGTDSYTITIEDFPIVDGGPDITTCVGNQVTLNATGADIYTWNYSLINGIPYLPNIGETEFIVQGSTNAGCSGTDTVLVTVLEDCVEEEEIVFWVPNTFTPDNDQFNQSWNVVFYSGYDPFAFELYVFNRWGELIWESHDVNIGWDGTYFNGRKCPDGVYTWKIKFKTLNSDDKRTAVGHLNLIR
ncbi:MAG: gliding motility-associated C-terminal domain-containing protein, partial [Bacteroidota bacterium]